MCRYLAYVYGNKDPTRALISLLLSLLIKSGSYFAVGVSLFFQYYYPSISSDSNFITKVGYLVAIMAIIEGTDSLFKCLEKDKNIAFFLWFFILIVFMIIIIVCSIILYQYLSY